MDAYGIHWFRRDLRVAGNPALEAAWKRNQGRVVGFFCFDPTFLARSDFSTNRFRFFLETLRALRDELRSIGSDLLVAEGQPDEAFPRLLRVLASKPQLITFNRDYEPFARARDARMLALLQKEWGLGVWTEADHLLVEPHEIGTGDSPYKVYSPFRKKWLALMRTEAVSERVRRQNAGLSYLQGRKAGKTTKPFALTWNELGRPIPDVLDAYLDKVRPTVPIPAAGSLAAVKCVDAFADKLSSYGASRDFPAENGTSRLSIYFKNGSLTVPQVVAALKLDRPLPETGGAFKFLSELIWREFYYSILFHFPHVETTAFQSRFSALPWMNKAEQFEAWKQGRTGYPLVDAGMRELNATGWMHNRVRMVVASFLTKHLLINWQWGEQYFMEKLLDGDLAPNNGGWQWAASTGCDPQPYFRIFNPYLQSEKFDPQGAYIRSHVPELRHLSAKAIHQPEGVPGYPPPLVEHAIARVRALKVYEAQSKKESKVGV